jgi:hypothetical protein
MTTTKAMFTIDCDGCDKRIAESNAILDVFDLARKAGAEYDEVVDEWSCADCLDNRAERAWEAHQTWQAEGGSYGPVSTGDPLTDYLRDKGEL